MKRVEVRLNLEAVAPLLDVIKAVADDLRDAVCDAESLGKPVGRDVALGRPSAVGEFGIEGAIARLESLVAGALDAVPPCAGQNELRTHVLNEATRLVPRQLARPAA